MILLFLWTGSSWAQNAVRSANTIRPPAKPVSSQLKMNSGTTPMQYSSMAGTSNFTPAGNQVPLAPLGTASPYVFAQASGTYTAISGGTSIGTTTDDEQVFLNLPIGFTFTYSGNAYTAFSVATNGFLAMGTTVATATLPISVAAGTNYVLCPLGVDLSAQAGTYPSDLQYKVLGSSPTRTLVVQWTNYKKKAAVAGADIFNFQVRLNESDNSIQFVYGAFTVNTTNSTPQVGIRASSSSDYSNRTVATAGLWASSLEGASNTATCALRAATKPASGQTYTWTPGAPYAPYTVPFFENFDLSGTLPVNWTAINYNGGTFPWEIYTYTGGAVSDPNVAGVEVTTSTNNQFLYLPALSLVGGHTYRVEFYYATGATGATERMTVGWGAAPTASPFTVIYTNTAITSTSFSLGTAVFTPAATGNYFVGFRCYSTTAAGSILLLDNVGVVEQFANDVGSISMLNPSQIPTGQQLPWFGKVKNFGNVTQTFGVDTKLRENAVLSSTQTNTVTSLVTLTTSSLSGNFNLSALGSGSSFDLAMQTNLAGDQQPSNDLITNYTRPCVNSTSYAWDDGESEGTVGFNTTSGWMGQLYYFSSPATIYSCKVMWGTIAGNLSGNSLEVYNVAAGVPTTHFADITTGINLTPSDQDTWESYDAVTPVVLPAGTYWIGIHQSVVLNGTYIVSNDQTGYNNVNYQAGHCFYSTTGATWTDYTTSSLYMFNMIRPDFAVVLCVNPSGFAVNTVPGSTSDLNLSWNLNLAGNSVLVAVSSDGVFGTPVDGHVYAANESITGGGTVLQYSNATAFAHHMLNPGQNYHYKIWSYSGTNYSSGVNGNAATPCDPTVAPISENFESGIFPPACWPALNGSLWADNTDASGYGVGAHSVLANFYNITAGTVFDLVTLPFDASSMPGPILKFDYAYAGYDATSIDDLKIYTSTDNGTTWTLLLDMPGGPTGTLNTFGGAGITTSSFVPTAAQWGTKTLSIANTVNKVKFTATSAYGNNLYVDNVKITQVYAHDVSVSAVDPIQCYPHGTVSPKATVTNYGTNAETAFTVTMTIDAYTSTKTIASLASNAAVVVTFDPWANTVGNYSQQACTSLSGDLNPDNDCMSQDVKVLNLNKQVYGYTTFTATDNGPITFSLSNPAALTELVNDFPVTTYPAGGSWANGTWYGSIYATAAPFNLVTFNTATGARTVIGNMGVNINAMSYNTSDNTMYGAGFDGTNSKLYTINLSTGAATFVATIGPRLVINMAINNAGICYVTDLSHNQLGTVNLTTGLYTIVGPVGFSAAYAQDMEFDRETGELYMAAYGSTGQLRWVDVTTGNTLLIGNFQGGAEVTGFAIPYSNALPLAVTGVVTNATCFGSSNGSITTNTSGGVSPYAYLWSNGATTANLAGIPAGSYAVTVTDATLATATGSWSVGQFADLEISSVVTDASCPTGSDGSINLTILGEITISGYLWSTGAITEDIAGLNPGSYTVTITDGNLCNKVASWTVGQTNAVCSNISVIGTASSTVCYNATTTITVAGGATIFTVVAPSGNATFIAGQNILFEPGTVVQSGAYMHGYISGIYCLNPSSPNNVAATGQDEPQMNLSNAYFTLFPNPTNGNFTLVQKGDKQFGNVKVEVYGMRGNRVLASQMIGEKQHEFTTSDLSAGLYFVKVVAEDYTETIKLIKTR